ncbi:MAG: DNA repair protein RadA [Tepidisphaerales bacterium]
MARAKVHFLCSACGAVQPKWMGKCPECGAWDALQEFREPAPDRHRADVPGTAESEAEPLDASDGARDGAAEAAEGEVDGAKPQVAVEAAAARLVTPRGRLTTGIAEFDRVLGGGMVPGSVVLVGGEPGIGKSTLLLQAATALAARGVGVLYVSSEESVEQTRLRAQRLRRPLAVPTAKARKGPPAPAPGAPATAAGGPVSAAGRPASAAGGPAEGLQVLAEGNLERIRQQVTRHRPHVLILDSVQMAYTPDLPAAPGSVSQLREVTLALVSLAKRTGTAVLLVGHVTKQGVLAGPKLLEHVVDTVVYFEGDRYHAHRLVRCVKNRFGSTQEVGLFRMTGTGLEEVDDPGHLFAEHYGWDDGVASGGETRPGPPSGSVLTATLSGSRVLLVEVQALTASSVIGVARRKASGVGADRLAMILAVLEKRAGLRLAAEDVFVNVVGGVKLAEPGVDLAVALAVASAFLDKPMPAGTLAVGELGLGGEVRPVPQLDQRLVEASRLGVRNAWVPPLGSVTVPPLKGMSVRPVRRLTQALEGL